MVKRLEVEMMIELLKSYDVLLKELNGKLDAALRQQQIFK
jgi:hypothetical protein